MKLLTLTTLVLAFGTFSEARNTKNSLEFIDKQDAAQFLNIDLKKRVKRESDEEEEDEEDPEEEREENEEEEGGNSEENKEDREERYEKYVKRWWG